MDASPIKTLDSMPLGKESLASGTVTQHKSLDPSKPSADVIKNQIVASNTKVEEADEPLLQENPQRFVLFPIRYHEVRVARYRSGSP